jgi:hypothetical protein
MDLVILVLFLAGQSRPETGPGRAKPMETAMWASIGAFLLWAAYGAMRGGDTMEMRLQLHTPVITLFAGLMQIRVFRTPRDLQMLGKTVVYACLFRFAMMFTFYLTTMRFLTVQIETVTDHGDSILFVTGIVIAVANALHTRTRKATVRAVVIVALMLWCIQINNRRLAWIGLVGSLVVMYALSQTGPFRRKVNRQLLRVAPILGLYVAVGWTQPTGIFKPLASLQSVNDPNNPSTQSRVLEDMGLIITLQNNPLLGTGFGQQYIEISTTYSVGGAIFPEYRYLPHNSVLGLVAFTGALGFAGIWMVFPVTAYFNARGYMFGQTPLQRTIAMASLCEVFIHTNQLWGDLGILAPQGVVLVSGAMAAASRISVHSGGWPATKRPQPAPAPPPLAG